MTLDMEVWLQLNMEAQLLIDEGGKSLLAGDFERSEWALDAAILLDQRCQPRLWQRGLCCFYMGKFEKGIEQFEADMDANGGDLEEVVWHFICKCGKIGFQDALKDGFLPLRAASNSPPPMAKVLSLFKGLASPDDVLASAQAPDGTIVLSYNNTNALSYANFYIGIYYQLQGKLDNARVYLQKAAEMNDPDYMGQLMQLHYKIFINKVAGLRTLMPTFALGDKKPSRVLYGCWQLSAGHGKREMSLSSIISNMLKVIDVGITAFDCGDIYTGVEELLGKMLTSHAYMGGKREDVSIHTKLVPDLDVIKAGGVSNPYVEGVVRRSLNRLKTDYLDLVQLHWWDTGYHGYIDAADCLKRLKEKGLVRQIGITNFDLGHTKELLDAGIPIASTQVQLSVLDQRPLNSGLINLCVQHGISIIAYGVLAGGFLTDRWIGQPAPSEFTNRSLVKYSLIIDEFGGWEKFQTLLKVLQKIAISHSPFKTEMPNGKSFEVDRVTVVMVAIAYVLQQSAVGGVILGSPDLQYAKECIGACQLSLNFQDLKKIEELISSSPGPCGEVYGLERTQRGRHSAIMKYNLNQLNEAAHLEELCVRYIELMFSAYPVEATRSGYSHWFDQLKSRGSYWFSSDRFCCSSELYDSASLRSTTYDHHLNLVAKNDVQQYLARVSFMLQEVNSINVSTLDSDQAVDLELIKSQLNLELVKWQELKQHERDPSLYLPFDAFNYLLPSWGPEATLDTFSTDLDQEPVQLSHPGVAHLSPVFKLLAILSRLRQLPHTLSAGQVNSVQPIKVFSERAVSLCDDFIKFLESDFEPLVGKMASFNRLWDDEQVASLIKEILFASKVTSRAISVYKTFVNDKLLPIASENVAIGRTSYEKLLALDHMILDSSLLLELGQDHFTAIKQELEELAAEISPDKTWQELTEDLIRPDHPPAEGLLQAYMNEIYRAKKHVSQLDLIPELPQGEEVKGLYTPPFLIPFSPFGDFLNPSPFARMRGHTSTSCTGYLMLHPVNDRGMDSEEKERLLRSHDHSWIRVIAPHECYPGHHVQALLAQSNPRPLRKYHISPFFYEGWGLYCEQLAYETGFFAVEEKGEGSLQVQLTRLTQLRLRLWRAARVILDIRLHRGELTLEECCRFLCSEVMFDPHSAMGEVLMYASRPTYAPCYVTGFVKLFELRSYEMQKCLSEGRDFELKSFHSKVLRAGSLPFPLLEKLFHDN